MPKCGFSTLLKSHFSMDIPPKTFCIFLEHLFIITHLEGCFWIQRDLKGLLLSLLNLTPRNRNEINLFKTLNHSIILLERKTQMIFKLLDEKLYIFLLATSKTWTRTLKNLGPEKPGSWKTWTLKNLDSEKPGPRKAWILKNME